MRRLDDEVGQERRPWSRVAQKICEQERQRAGGGIRVAFIESNCAGDYWPGGQDENASSILDQSELKAAHVRIHHFCHEFGRGERQLSRTLKARGWQPTRDIIDIPA